MQLRDLSLDCLASGEGLAALTQLTSLALAPQQGARIALRGLPRLRRLALDLSSGSCGWDLLSPDRSSAHVPAGGHGLASLAELELRCFVWRHYCEAGAASDDGGGSGGSSETAADTDSSGDGSDGEEADSLAADEEGMEEEGAAGADAAWPEEEEGEAEDGGHPAGLLQASWGFLQELQPPAAGGPDLAAAALAALEQR